MDKTGYAQTGYAQPPTQEMTNIAGQSPVPAPAPTPAAQTVYVQQGSWNSYPGTVTAQPTGQSGPNAPMVHTQPPRQQWRDNLCDCCNNIWPSCGCTMCFHGLGSAWLVSQIAQKTGYMNFQSIMRPFAVIWGIAWIIFWLSGETFGIIFLIPALLIYVISILLRFHLVKTYQIEENGMTSCATGCCCFACSVAQMARHVYGYTKVFDGDADPERADAYRPIVEQPVLPQNSTPYAQNPMTTGNNSNVTYVSNSV